MIHNPTDLVDVKRADVYKNGRLAAVLERHVDSIEFRYHEEYLDDPAEAVATTLPVTAESTMSAPGAVPAFFAGLLPEGRRLSAVRRAVKTSADDEFTLVLAVGTDTIGDVQVVPAGEGPPSLNLETADPVAAWDELDFGELFERSIGSDPEFVGIPGVQEKISGQMIAFPMAEGRSILKLNPPEFPHIVENEAFFLTAAREANIRSVEYQIVYDRAGNAGLLIKRFDRLSTEHQPKLLAQEDGCQVMNRYPADKYQLATAEVINGLATVTGAPKVAAYELLRILTFSYLSGNGDLHAKNLSVYRPDDEWRVAPAYDLPSTYFYGDFTLALAIAEDGRNKDISRRVMIELAKSVGVPQRAAERLVNEQLEASESWLARVDDLPFDERSKHKYVKFVQHRRRLLTS